MFEVANFTSLMKNGEIFHITTPKEKKNQKKKGKVWQFFAITQATEPVLRGWGNELKVSWKYWVKERTVLGILY